MKKITLIEQVRTFAKQLLNCEDDNFIMKSAADSLYKIFSEITGIYFENNQDQHVELPTGRALSASCAAHCLIEFKRTAIFLRGIRKAINNKKSEMVTPVRILYAGCGPYATLITPILSLYSTSDICVALMDINETSLNAAERLILKLNLNDFVDEYLLTDATKFQNAGKYDIIISETMQACLENEPQVHIMNNLIPQMKQDAIFIPQEISVDVYLSDPKLFNEKILYKNRNKNIRCKKFLCNFIKLNKNTLGSLSKKCLINVPALNGNFKFLNLYTFIRVYGQEKLQERECSLNRPRTFYDISVQDIDNVEFWLDYSKIPVIRCRMLTP